MSTFKSQEGQVISPMSDINAPCQNASRSYEFSVLYTFFCSLRENTHSFARIVDQQREDTLISAKKPTFAHKSDSITIFLHFNQHSITFLGIHLRHSTYKREKYVFINTNMRVINITLKIIRDNRQTFKCRRYSFL